jgi:hypothetical protein
MTVTHTMSDELCSMTCDMLYNVLWDMWGAYSLALPLGQYPFGIPPERDHTYQHSTCKRTKTAVGPKPKSGLPVGVKRVTLRRLK